MASKGSRVAQQVGRADFALHEAEVIAARAGVVHPLEPEDREPDGPPTLFDKDLQLIERWRAEVHAVGTRSIETWSNISPLSGHVTPAPSIFTEFARDENRRYIEFWNYLRSREGI
jgi:hypothetical protein